MIVTAYSHKSRSGTFWIRLSSQGRWHVLFEDEDLGSYAQPQQALDDLASGATYWPSCGNPAALRLPDELAAWSPHSGR